MLSSPKTNRLSRAQNTLKQQIGAKTKRGYAGKSAQSQIKLAPSRRCDSASTFPCAAPPEPERWRSKPNQRREQAQGSKPKRGVAVKRPTEMMLFSWWFSSVARTPDGVRANDMAKSISFSAPQSQFSKIGASLPLSWRILGGLNAAIQARNRFL